MSEAPRKTPPRMIEVLATQTISPRLRRITFGGPQLAGFGPSFPAAHIKLFFPRKHQLVPRLPTIGAGGRPVWPEAGESPVVRTYSLRQHDPVAQTIDVDFVLHEPAGPAARWAEGARPGMKIGLAGPGGPTPMLKAADWYLLAGDLSALPAISCLLANLNHAARGFAFVQLEDERDKQPLRLPDGIRLTWLITNGQATPATDLVQTVQHTLWPEGRPQVWLAGENSQVVALRDLLLERFPSARANMYAVPYWKRRESEEQYHKERHRVMDELAAE
jgi:NADPH-dependent ferric siderophore reductase